MSVKGVDLAIVVCIVGLVLGFAAFALGLWLCWWRTQTAIISLYTGTIAGVISALFVRRWQLDCVARHCSRASDTLQNEYMACLGIGLLLALAMLALARGINTPSRFRRLRVVRGY